MSEDVVVGVDVGGTKILGVALDRRGDEIASPARAPTPHGSEVLRAVVEIVGRVAGEGRLGAVGIGLPGLVDRDGRLRMGPNLPGLVDTPFAAEIKARTRVPVIVENDASCAAWAEHARGAARGAHHAVAITLGTGIGGGIITGGRLLRGANGFGGEPGHMVVDPHGPRCPCGRRGCWERYASGAGLSFLAREAALAQRGRRMVELAGGDPEAVRGEHVTAAARAGDADALEVFRQFGWWLALGIANLANLLDPEVVVLAGGLIDAADLFVDEVRRSFDELVMGGQYRDVRIVAAELGERAGAIGAALLAESKPA